MVRWLHILCILVMAIFAAKDVHGQFQFRFYETLGKEQGLPDDEATCMIEDDDGFLWIGTSEGLARYDGATFKTFRHNDSLNSIIDNRIRDLAYDGDYLWIGTHVGLSRYDLNSGIFRNYTWTHECDPVVDYEDAEEAVQELHIDRHNDVWIGTQHCGFARYDSDRDTFVLVTPDVSDMPFFDGIGTLSQAHKYRTRNIYAFCDDMQNDSIVWVGSVSALIKYNKVSGEIRYITKLLADPTLRNQVLGFRVMYYAPDGFIYSTAHHHGLIAFDSKEEIFGLEPSPRGVISDVLNGGVTDYLPQSDSIVWITTGRGIVEFNAATSKYTGTYLENVDHRFNLIYRDKEDRILAATREGILVFDPIQQQFEASSFAKMNGDHEGYVYAVTHDTAHNRYYACARVSGGLFYYDLGRQAWNKVDVPWTLFRSNSVSFSDMSPMSDGTYLLTTGDEVVRYDPETHEMTQIPVTLPLTVRRLQDVYVDSRGVAWISSREDGVFTWNSNTNELRNYKFPEERQSVAPFDSETFKEDSRGRVWMKRRSGYSIYFPGADSIAHFYPEEMHGAYNGSLAQDGLGNFWVASLPGWLGRVPMDSVELGVVERFKIPLASKSNPLQSMAIGPEGYIWCALQSELVKINPLTRDFETFSYTYGHDPSEHFSMQFMEDGMLVFGMRNELIIADPASLQRNRKLPEPYITEILVGGEKIDKDTVAHRIECLRLKPRENYLSIGFSTFGRTLGEYNSIQYRLSPLQERWVDAGQAGLANFSNVPSGDYTFEMRASNNDGFVNPDTFTLPISIGTPWYNTAWARLLFAATIIGLMYLGYRYRIEQIRSEERLRSEFERKLGETQMSALRAQMNPHFIFNCLNSIENFVIKNDTYRASTYLNDFARLIRLILQNSRLRSVPLQDEMEALELYLQMESLRFTDRFNYEIVIEESVDVNSIEIPPMLIQPYVENAIWHGLMHKETPGNLKVNLSCRNEMLECVIQDDGVGRKRALQIKEQKQRQRKKKSMGMSITQDRIKMLNSLHNTNTEVRIIDLHNDDGDALGTRVEISIAV